MNTLLIKCKAILAKKSHATQSVMTKGYQAGAVTAESDQIIRIDKNQDITSYSVQATV